MMQYIDTLALMAQSWRSWQEDRTTSALTKQYFYSFYLKNPFLFTEFSAALNHSGRTFTRAVYTA
jgi:hypothetical protein